MGTNGSSQRRLDSIADFITSGLWLSVLDIQCTLGLGSGDDSTFGTSNRAHHGRSGQSADGGRVLPRSLYISRRLLIEQVCSILGMLSIYGNN